MYYLDSCKLDTNIAVHLIGNKTNGDKLILSDSLTKVNEEVMQYLQQYFLTDFKSPELFTLHHDTSLQLNEVYCYITEIFQNKSSLHSQSLNIARHLYNNSTHQNIKKGEFYVVYITGCFINGIETDAIGLFKSENKDVFIEIEQTSKKFEILSRNGININKLDKGCLIFNIQRESGYLLSIIDNINKKKGAQYWQEDFLNAKILNNEYNQTNEFLDITKEFITNILTDDFEVNKADQIDFLNRSVNYFKENTTFDKNDFEEKVFEDAGIIDSFRNYENNFKEENEVVFEDNFEISSQAVKKQARKFKSVLKLDRNFHIYIHGDRDLIEQGIDEKGRKFYKIYYEEEN